LLDFTNNFISSKIYSKGHFTAAYGHGSNKTLKGQRASWEKKCDGTESTGGIKDP
jgi:hypothetical protein